MIVLVLGGTRSGKSEVAERITAQMPAPITYVATATVGDDPDLASRVATHRARRPESWNTIEAPVHLPEFLRELGGTVLVDSLGTWIASAPGFGAEVDALRAACRERGGDTVLVSEEVGFSVHPPTEVGRRFVDALGSCNRSIAEVADRVLLVVAGRTLELGGADA